MKRLLVLCSVVLLFSCANREEVVEQTYPNGNKKIVMIYEGDGVDRKAIEQKSYYIGGQTEVTGQFDANAKRNGNWIYYYENGNKWSECEYTSGIRNGNSVTYFENGSKRYQGNYKEDKQIGHWIFYNGDGSIDNEKDY
ncbi:MAG: hypothetical protein HOB26_04670 [Flavobacteriales bacterium]|nr:hypothetical protein [Flavobacteriales bacterium]